MTPGMHVVAAFAAPLAGSLLVALAGRRPNLRETLTLLTGAATILLVAALVPRVIAGEPVAFTFLEVLPGLTLAFEVERLGLLFALVASGLWIVTSLYAMGYLRAHHEEHQTRFFFFFAVAIACTLGIAFAGNLLTLFVFYEALTLSTYPLVTHHGTEEARRAGRVYLGILLTTSIGLLFTAIVWTWRLTGTLDFRVGGILAGKASDPVIGVLLALFVFGTGKAALMPFHRWLPAAMVAPTPVSALLHAVAVVKAGVFTVLKIVVYVFGTDFLRAAHSDDWLSYVAGISLLMASLVALTKGNLKARLAYSTVSQLAYVVAGASLANSWGLIGGGMHVLMHAFGKITLFFCAGAIYVTAHKTEIRDMTGIGRSMPVTMAAYWIGALSVIGLPPFGGSWSKWCLAMGAAEAGQTFLLTALMLSSLLGITYLMPLAVRAFFAPESGEVRVKEAPLACLIPICATAAGCLVLFFGADRVYGFLAAALRTGGSAP